MRFLILAVPALVMCMPSSVSAQAEDWPEYSSQQRWDRASMFATLGLVTTIRYAKEHGASVDEFGGWWADLFVPSWGEPMTASPTDVMRGMRRNNLSWPEATVEIVSATDDAVTARWSRSWASYFGDNQTLYGVTLAEFESVFFTFVDAVAEYHGLESRHELDGNFFVVTFARR